MSFTNNELFLILFICLLCIIIGALFYNNYLQHKELKALKKDLSFSVFFTNKVLTNIAVRENIDIEKYIDMTQNQVHNSNEGGEINE
jgi:hypothetical protein